MGTTKVILNEKVENLGEKFEICEVKRGYAMNYLLPEGLAVMATAPQIRKSKEESKKAKEAVEAMKEQLSNLVLKLAGKEITLAEKISEKGRLYGSVTEKDIASALNKEFNVSLDDSVVVMKEHIKELGQFNVKLDLGNDMKTEVIVNIIKK